MTTILLVIIYLAFISLGLPDSLLGSAWPTIHVDMNVPISYIGLISMTISLGTIVSSLSTNVLKNKLGTGRIVAYSTALTALALFGFSISTKYYQLILWAIPYGIGAGSIDAALNNYVALNYKSRHMSWLHCMWGVGAAASPYIMAYALGLSKGWTSGYAYVSYIQIALTVILVISLPLWKANDRNDEKEVEIKTISIKEAISIKGAKEILICFFCYNALEQTVGLWASSYLNIFKGISYDKAASYAALFFIGITAGRAISGFITMKLNDDQMIRLGQTIILIGIVLVSLPLEGFISLLGLIIIGLGCAPIYPCIIHSTPDHFGKDNSQAVIGLQMASAYIGVLTMPPLFGVIANKINIGLLPLFLTALLVIMFITHKLVIKHTKGN